MICTHTDRPQRASNRAGERFCDDCANASEHESFAAMTYAQTHVEPFFAYLDRSGNYVTTWLGHRLARVTFYERTNAGFGGWRRGEGRIYFSAVDDFGRHWYGNSPGNGMYCRLRLRKTQPIHLPTERRRP